MVFAAILHLAARRSLGDLEPRLRCRSTASLSPSFWVASLGLRRGGTTAPSSGAAEVTVLTTRSPPNRPGAQSRRRRASLLPRYTDISPLDLALIRGVRRLHFAGQYVAAANLSVQHLPKFNLPVSFQPS